MIVTEFGRGLGERVIRREGGGKVIVHEWMDVERNHE